MSWKEYQDDLVPQSRARKWHLPAGFFALLVFVASMAFWLRPDVGRSSAQEAAPVAEMASVKEKWFRNVLDMGQILEGNSEIRFKHEGQDAIAHLTLDEDFQRFLSKKLRNYRPDWAGVVAVDAGTGQVLALGSHSEKDPQANDWALRATYPAASIFKIVTAAAAVEKKGFEPTTGVRYEGNPLKIRFREILRETGAATMSLGEGFARSANMIFAKVGANTVGRELLLHYGDQFGFNSGIPFELKQERSELQIAQGDPIEAALAGAGFGDVTLSPLHGALLAASIVNGGVMMEPYLVERVRNMRGEQIYEAHPREWKRPISFSTARELRSMMMKTVSMGTARRAFRGADRDRILKLLDLGGKTGSLRGKNPKGRTEWFVGYAGSASQRIAVGVVLVSDKVWKVKPADLAYELFHYYYSPRPVLASAAVQPIEGP